MRRAIYVGVLLIVLCLIAGIYLYPNMPSEMPSHWNTKGEVDDYMPKFWGLFLMPMIIAVMLVLFTVLPNIDPVRKNLKDFKVYYENFIILVIIFLFYIYLLTLFASIGVIFDMTTMIMPALGFLMYFIGGILEKTKPNWFIGIRNPWTLSNKKVWEKTHRRGSVLFKATGLLTIIGMLFHEDAYLFLLIPLLFSVVYLFIYSYLEYKKEKK